MSGLNTSRLENVKDRDGKITARCPACTAAGGDQKGDHLFLTPDGKFGCIKYPGHAGAEHRKEIFAMVGEKQIKSASYQQPRKAGRIYATAEEAAKQCTPPGATFEAIFQYCRDGKPFAAVGRYLVPGDKTFLQFHPKGNGWGAGGPQGKWPLSRLEALSGAGPVHVFEGEKKTNDAASVGLNAITSAGGAQAAAKTDWSSLAGRDVCVWPDADEPGEQYAESVARILSSLTPPACIKIVRLPFEIGSGLDVADFIGNGNRLSELSALAEIAPLWESQTATTTIQPETKPTEEFFYDKAKKEYLLRNKRECWLSLTETQFKKELAYRGYRTRVEQGEDVSPADRFIINLRDTRDVDYIGPLAGYPAGFYEMNGHRVLVTSSPQIIIPIAGEWPILSKMLSDLFADEHYDQLQYFYGWLKIAYEALLSGQRRPGQAMAVAGPHDCGKSLVQKIITLILGGRLAKPYAFMTQSTNFNADMFEAEHLCIEDEPASTDIRTRRAFGAQIKQVTACDTQRCHAKHKQAITLSPLWRLTITLNDEPENLMVLPPIDDSIEDKIIILQASHSRMPMPTATHEERGEFWKCIVSEIPAFLYVLSQWQIPEELRSERYGITHFHHPDILREIDALAPEYRLSVIIDNELFSGPCVPTWKGTAEDLEMRLTNHGEYQHEARKLLNWNNSTGTYLGRLAKKYPVRYSRDRTNTRREWIICPPSESLPLEGGS